MDDLIMEAKYKVGEAVLFINGYGMTYNDKFMYRYGELVCGFITSIEYIEPRKSYIYTIGTLAPSSTKRPMYRVLSEYFIFNLEEEDKAVIKLVEICEEPDEE